jgi:ribosomal protein L40E
MGLMKCPRCGYENPPNAHLCEKCRYPLFPNTEEPYTDRKCPRCGYENPPNAHLCEKCRYPLNVPVVKFQGESKPEVPPEVMKGMSNLRLFSSYYVLAFLIFQASISVISFNRTLAEGVAVASGLLMLLSLRYLYDATGFLIRKDKALINRVGVYVSIISTFLVGAGGYEILPYVKPNGTVNLVTSHGMMVASFLLVGGILLFLVGNVLSVVLTQFELSREFGNQFRRAGQLFLISFVLGLLTFIFPLMELISFFVLLYASYLVTDASVKSSNGYNKKV